MSVDPKAVCYCEGRCEVRVPVKTRVGSAAHAENVVRRPAGVPCRRFVIHFARGAWRPSK